LNKTDNIINCRISKLKKKRDRKIKQYCKAGSLRAKDDAHTLSYTLKKVIKRKKRRVAAAKLRTSDSGGFWKLINSITGRTCSNVPVFKVNGSPISEQMASDMIASFFDEKIAKLSAGFIDELCELDNDGVDVVISREILDRSHKRMKP
jgi:hypothetical protein